MVSQLGEPKVAVFLRAGMAVFLFLLVLALLPIAYDPANDVKILLYHWAGFLLVTALLLGTWIEKAPIPRPRLFSFILVAFLALNAAACLRSHYVAHSMVEVRKLFSLVLLYFVAAYAYRTPAHVRRLMVVVCIAVGLSSMYAFLQHVGLDPFPWADTSLKEYAELPATFGNANFAAHTLVLCIVMAVYLGTYRTTFWCLGLVPVYVLHLYLTHQRGGIIALAAAFAVLAIAKLLMRPLKRPGAAIAAALAAAVLLGALGAGGVMLASMRQTGVPFPLKRPLLLRYHAYAGAAEMVRTRPMLGYGPGNYVIENPPFWSGFEQENFAVNRFFNDHVHNDVLETAVDAGMPAAGLYVMFLICGIVAGLYVYLAETDPERRRFGAALAAFFCAFLVDGLFGFNSRVPVSAVLLLVFAGALEGVWRRGTRPEPKPLPRKALLWRLGVVAAACVALVFDTRVFAAQLLLQRANGAMQWGDDAAAGTILATGKRLAPWNWLLTYQRGVVRMRQGDLEGAIAHFEHAVTLNPNYVMTLVKLGQANLNLSQAVDAEASESALERAAAAAEQALALCPVLPEGEDILGRVCFARAVRAPSDASDAERTKSWEAAEDHLRRAIEYRAGNIGELYRLLAHARMALAKTEGAGEALVRSANADPAADETWQLFHEYAARFKRFALMRNVLRGRIWAALKEDQTAPEVLSRLFFRLGMSCLQDAGSRDAAELLYDELKGFSLSDVQRGAALLNFGAALFQTGEWGAAETFLGEATPLLSDGDLAICARFRAAAFVKRGYPSDAANALETALVRAPEQLELRLVLARVLVRCGRFSDARAAYTALLQSGRLSEDDRARLESELTALPSP